MLLRLLLATLFLILGGCSSLNVQTDYNPGYDFSKLKRFAVIYPKNEAITLTQERIAKAVTDEMASKGFVETDKAHADFYIVFHLDVTTRKQVVTDYQAVGLYPYYYGYRTPIVMVPVEREYTYEEAKIIIDALDPHGNNIFWRGVATDRLHSFKTPNERMKYIREVVKEVMKSFPPKKRH
ncbi:DUF4136 domain-containing protein [Hydrogenimonas cancrithermarum]|uniref:DUF4136 domain-containing protein n=1 Tax=Hydrogenimonas cancrithermarum TaxID=2993563 RepID=A0ABN6WW32_9BACT|nr:DUF4136 domain-containing protein [Hydrogenimonas cancrithermarum]BDY13325.1 hypothetical protein HCR_16370 [Hydrogenimonas cancrithermarum]